MLTASSTLPTLTDVDGSFTPWETSNGTPYGTKPRKRKRDNNTHFAIEGDLDGPDLDMSISPEATKTLAKKRRRNGAASPDTSRTSSTKKVKEVKQPQSPTKARKGAIVGEDTPPLVQPAKGKCLRCREKAIKCNEAKPTCNQCRRDLWTCQYEQPGIKKRSKNGCLNCKTRRRKCTEERPSCAYCLKTNHGCEYAD